MKFSIAFIALLCVSTINSSPVSKNLCPKFDHDLIVEIVQNIVSHIPYWRVDGPFRDNLLNFADKFVKAAPAHYWDEKLDAKNNLVILTELVLINIPRVELDLQKSLESNVGTLVQFMNNHYPITLNKTEVLYLIARVSTVYGFEGIDAKKSLYDNVVIFVEAGLKNIKVENIHSFEDWVDAVFVEETDHYTIQEIIAGFLDVVYMVCLFSA